MIVSQEKAELDGLLEVARLMCIAARTAPKCRGRDYISTAILTGKEKSNVTKKMREIASEGFRPSTFNRDADSVDNAQALVLIGTKKAYLELDCTFCGFSSCEEAKKNSSLCIYNSVDLGIAIGSAVSVTNQHKIDNRIMFTVGLASVKAHILGRDVNIILGIPLSVTGKNIFFDRK